MSRELWDIQEVFTRKFWKTKGGMPDKGNLVAVTKDYALHLITEVTEVIGELSWKMHRVDSRKLDRDNLLEEMIDCLKFTYGMMQVNGFTWKEVEDEFKRKSAVVDQRFDQEQSFPDLMHWPVAIIDIDGVLADYPNCFYEFLATTYFVGPGNERLSLSGAKEKYSKMKLEDREWAKVAYRQSGVKRALPVLPGARELLDLLRASGLKIVLLTNRPYSKYYRIYPDTLEWLKANELVYDAILWTHDKGLEATKYFSNIRFAVDDQDSNVQRLREARIITIKVDSADETRSTAALLKLANSLSKVEDLGYEWNKLCNVVWSENLQATAKGRAA